MQQKIFVRAFLGIIYIVILMSAKMHAEEADKKSADKKSDVKQLERIVTSSTGFDLPLKDEQKNILIVDKEALQDKGYTNLQQALQYNPLVTFSDNGFGSNIDLRGQGRDANRAVKILVNRVPITLLDTSHGLPPYNNIDIEDIERIEVIPGGGAVVYGNGTRGGVVNIVTKTPSKDFARLVLKATSGEALGLQGGSLGIAGGKRIGEKLFIRGDVSVGYIPGARNTAGTATDRSAIKAFSNDNMTNLYTALQTIWTPSEDQKLDFNVSYTNLWRSFPLSYLTYTTTTGRSTGATTIVKDRKTLIRERNKPDEYTIKTENRSLQSSLDYTAKWNQNLDFDALGFYQFSLIKYTQYEYCTSTRATAAFNCPGGIMNMGDPSGFQNHGGGLNLKIKHTTRRNTLIVGLDNILEYSRRINFIDHDFPYYRNQTGGAQGGQGQNQNQIVHYTVNMTNTATKLSNSLYVFDSFAFAKSFNLSGGARVELSNYWTDNIQDYVQENKNNNQYTTSREHYDFKNYHTSHLGYAAEITPNFRYSDTGDVYAKAELGFISPSPYQMINADPKSSLNANKPQGAMLNRNEVNGVKPEQYITAEIGTRNEFNRVYFAATLFYTHTFDEIFVNAIGHGTAYTYGNLGQTSRAGLELVSSQKFFDSGWLRLSESASLLYSEVLQTNIENSQLKGKMIPFTPWLKATLNIESDVYKSSTFLCTIFWNNAYYSQSIDTVPGNGTRGTSNIMNKGGYVLSDLGLIFGLKDFKINLGIRNLFDSWYVTYQKYPNYMPAIGRSYYVELRYSF